MCYEKNLMFYLIVHNAAPSIVRIYAIYREHTTTDLPFSSLMALSSGRIGRNVSKFMFKNYHF